MHSNHKIIGVGGREGTSLLNEKAMGIVHILPSEVHHYIILFYRKE